MRQQIKISAMVSSRLERALRRYARKHRSGGSRKGCVSDVIRLALRRQLSLKADDRPCDEKE